MRITDPKIGQYITGTQDTAASDVDPPRSELHAGGWIGKTLTWVVYLVVAGLADAFAPKARPFIGGTFILGLGAAAALMPYAQFRKFLTCGIRLLCWLAIAWMALRFADNLYWMRDDPPGSAAVVTASLVMAFGFWMLRKISDFQRAGKMSLPKLLLAWTIWAVFCVLVGGIFGLGIWILAGIAISLTVRSGLKAGGELPNRNISERAVILLRILARWAGYGSGIAGIACLILAARWAPGRLLGLWDWVLGRNPIDEWIWMLGFPDPRFKPPMSGVHPVVLLAHSLAYVIGCIGFVWLASVFLEWSEREPRISSETQHVPKADCLPSDSDR